MSGNVGTAWVTPLATVEVSSRILPTSPTAQERLRVTLANDLLGQPSYRFWFLRKNGKPIVCLETSGFVWIRNEAKTHDLMDLYNKNNRNIWSTVVAAAGSLMA